jgi:hypothetical protein
LGNLKYISSYPLIESNGDLSPRQERLLDLIMKNTDNWIKAMKSDLDKSSERGERFMDHYSVIDLINKKPNEMASVFYKAIDHEGTANWISSNLEEFPDSFKDSIGVSSDMKKLGF